MSDEARKEGFVPPPHINAEAHRRVMEWLREASAEEVAQTAVRAGIYTPEGKLALPYRDAEEGEEEVEQEKAGDREEEKVTIKVPKELVSAVEKLVSRHAG